MSNLQDEIARVVSADQTTIAEPDLNKMEYLKAVFKEVLRLHPPAPLLVPHESTTPAVVQGYEIPAKTALFVISSTCGPSGVKLQRERFGALRLLTLCPVKEMRRFRVDPLLPEKNPVGDGRSARRVRPSAGSTTRAQPFNRMAAMNNGPTGSKSADNGSAPPRLS